MLKTLKSILKNDIHRKWESETDLIKTKYTSFYPSDYVGEGDKNFICDGLRRSVCKVYCCSRNMSAMLNPLEAILLSHKTSKPHSSFLQLTRPEIIDYSNQKIGIPTSTPFELKTEGDYCIFNSMPTSEDCKIYPFRPLQCRTFPLNYKEHEGLIQRKGCPGFKRGDRLTKDEVLQITRMGMVSNLLGRIIFDIKNTGSSERKEDLPSVSARYIWKNMGINSDNTVETLTEESFHQYVERMKRISNLEKEMKEGRIEQKSFENFMLKSFEEGHVIM